MRASICQGARLRRACGRVVERLESRRLLSVGPDGYGYVGDARAAMAIDLAPGAAGVLTLLDAADNAAAFVPLGSNTFNFYGTTYGGSGALAVSTNGLITFGSSVSSADNTDLSSGPPQAAIAALWDDWVTDFATSAAGASNDAVLYQLDEANNRLIVEWNHVRRFGFTAFGDVTFQAILQLNTGSLPGTITFNYPDITIGHAWYDNGADASVGIKPAGAPPTTRLLVEQNSGVSGLVSSGAAVDVAWHASPISGKVFQDNDGDGLAEAGEPGLAGVTVYLDANNNATMDAGEAATVSDGAGNYGFANLLSGTYLLRQSAVSGQIAPAAKAVTTSPGVGTSGVDFANLPTTFNGSAGGDSYVLRLDQAQAHAEVLVSGVPTFLVNLQVVTAVQFKLAGGDDTLTLDNSRGNVLDLLDVSYDGGTQSVGGGDGVVIEGTSGDDSITLDGQAPLTLMDVERATVNGNAGNDVVSLGSDAALAITLNGGAGSDALVYQGSQAGDVIDVATTSIIGGGHSARFFTTELVSVLGLGGSDLIRVNSTGPGVNMVVIGGEGDDGVTMGAGVLDAIPGIVSVFGDDGADWISLDDQLSTNNYQYAFNGNSFTRDFFGALSWFGVEQVTLNEAGGNNATIVQPPSEPALIDGTIDAPSILTINGNSGNDVLSMMGNMAPLVVFNGGMGASEQDLLNVFGGTYTFLQDAALGSAHLSVNVAAAGQVMFSGSQSLSELSVSGRAVMAPSGAHLLHVASLSISDGATLDLADNDLIVDSAPFTTVRSWVSEGMGGVSGITSSSGNGTQALALFDNALFGLNQWMGIGLTPTSIVGKYTYFGDLNIDGRVTGDDYTVVDANLGRTAAVGTGWLTGDANLDARITGDDYTTVDSNLGRGVGNPLLPMSWAQRRREEPLKLTTLPGIS